VAGSSCSQHLLDRSVNVRTCSDPYTSSYGAGSLQVRVMELVDLDDTRRFCGGPLGTEGERRKRGEVGCID